MVINIAIKGGLGNQLFQYALGKYLESKYICKLYFDIYPLQTESPNLTKRYFLLDRIFSPIDFTSVSTHDLFYSQENTFIVKLFKKVKRIIARQKYISELLNSELDLDPRNNYYLDGYWQNSKYAKAICEELNVKLSHLAINIPFLKSIYENKESVAIHIRRGDYISNSVINSFHGCCTLDYYQAAISEVEKRKQVNAYFVFTDDLDWAKANIKHTKPVYFFDGNVDDPIIDLLLMKTCPNLILSNSSLSCWASYLNTNTDKVVIAPLNWTNKNKTEDLPLFDKEWVLV